jgi:hypothetical protein
MERGAVPAAAVMAQTTSTIMTVRPVMEHLPARKALPTLVVAAVLVQLVMPTCLIQVQ